MTDEDLKRAVEGLRAALIEARSDLHGEWCSQRRHHGPCVEATNALEKFNPLEQPIPKPEYSFQYGQQP